MLSCSWDLTRAFYNLFLYNTRAGRLKSSTRREAGLGLAATSLPPVYIFLGKRPLTATHAAHEWLCRSSEARRGKIHRTEPASQPRVKNASEDVAALF